MYADSSGSSRLFGGNLSGYYGRRATRDQQRKPLRAHGRKEFGKTKRWAVLMVILGAAIATIFTLAFTPIQEIYGQKAAEQAAENELAEEPALLHRTKQVWFDTDGWFWAFDELSIEDAKRIGKAYSGSPLSDKEMSRIGGVKVSNSSESHHKITLFGNRKSPVHVDKVRARLISEKKAPTDTRIGYPSQGVGSSDSLYIDLDSPDKLAFRDDGERSDKPFGIEENRYAEEGEPLDILITADTKKPVIYEWELVFNVSWAGKSGTVKVRSENGKPFKTVGGSGNYSNDYTIEPSDGHVYRSEYSDGSLWTTRL